MNISALIDFNIMSSISLLLGQISFKKTSLPSLSIPRELLYISKFILPAKAKATTSGGEAR